MGDSFEKHSVLGNRALPEVLESTARPFESLKERATHLFSSMVMQAASVWMVPRYYSRG